MRRTQRDAVQLGRAAVAAEDVYTAAATLYAAVSTCGYFDGKLAEACNELMLLAERVDEQVSRAYAYEYGRMQSAYRQ